MDPIPSQCLKSLPYQGRVNLNSGTSFSLGVNNDWYLACNDPRYQHNCLIYKYQVYFFKTNGVPPLDSKESDLAYSINFLNYSPSNVGVFKMETRSTKRTLVPELSMNEKRPFAASRRKEDEEP